MQQRGLELKSEIDRHESRIHFNEERLREFAAQNTKALADMTQAEERRSLRQQELWHASTKTLRSAEAALAGTSRSACGGRKRCAQVEGTICANNQEALRQAQADAFAAAQDLSRVRNEINALDLQKQGNVVRLEKLSAEKIQLEEERTRLEARLQEFAANVEAAETECQTQRGTVEERQKRLREIQEELNRRHANRMRCCNSRPRNVRA